MANRSGAYANFRAAQTGDVKRLDIASIDSTNEYGKTALMLSVNNSNGIALRTLLLAGADPNVPRFEHTTTRLQNTTALTIAVKECQIGLVFLLIKAGAFFTCERGFDALMLAIKFDFMDAVIEGDEVMKTRKGYTVRAGAFYLAYREKRFDLLETFINAGLTSYLKVLKPDLVLTDNIFTALLRSDKVDLNQHLADGNNILTLAAMYSNRGHTIIKNLIEKHVDLDFANSLGNTALHYASRTGQADLVILLLSSGAKTEIFNKHGRTPLMQSILSEQTEIVKILIANNANIEAVDANLDSALHYASRTGQADLVILLLSSGAKTEIFNKPGRTPLMQSILSKQTEIVKILLENNANIEAVDANLDTALHYASNSNRDIVKLLLEAGAKIDVNNSENLTPFSLACNKVEIEIMKLLIDAGTDINCKDKCHRTPLIRSVQGNNLKIARFLLEHRADVSQIDTNGRTALIWAAAGNSDEALDLLLEFKPDLNCVDLTQTTALVYAVMRRNVEMVAKLIQAGADVNIASNCQVDLYCSKSFGKNAYGILRMEREKLLMKSIKKNTPLHLSIPNSFDESVNKIVNLILEAGANVNLVDEHGRTPLHLSVVKGSLEITKALCQLGADINAVDISGNSAFFASVLFVHKELTNYLLECGADVNLIRDYSYSPLYVAVSNNDMELVHLLIKYGAIADKGIHSELLIAVKNKNSEVAIALLEHGAKVNLKCGYVCSPLYVAVSNNNTELVHLLIKYGAIADENIHSELLIAVKNKNSEVTIALLEHGADANIRDGENTPVLIKATALASPYCFIDMPTSMLKDRKLTRYFRSSNSRSMSKRVLWREKIIPLTESFLLKGADVSATDNEGNTCLHAAAEFCSAYVLELFVAHKADVNVQNVKGETPLMIACSVGNVEAVRYLLAVGADVMLVDVNKDTALHHAVNKQYEASLFPDIVIPESRSHTVALLIENNVNINARNGKGNTALHLVLRFGLEYVFPLLISNGAKVNEKNDEGDTPLFYVTDNNLIHYLIDAETEINLQNKLGETALHHACDGDIGLSLLEVGADKEIRTHDGRTALMYATAAGTISLAKALIEHGAKVNVQDNEGRNALMHAFSNASEKIKECCILLLENGADVSMSDTKGQTVCMIVAKDNIFMLLTKEVFEQAGHGQYFSSFAKKT